MISIADIIGNLNMLLQGAILCKLKDLFPLLSYLQSVLFFLSILNLQQTNKTLKLPRDVRSVKELEWVGTPLNFFPLLFLIQILLSTQLIVNSAGIAW